jgi:hypothetical protein
MKKRKGKRPVPSERKRLIRSGFQMYPAPFRVPLSSSIILQLKSIVVGSTDSSGIFAAAVPCDPSATLGSRLGGGAIFDEWTTIKALFSHVKCLQLEVVLRPCYIETKGDIVNNVAVSGNLMIFTSTPSGFATVMDNADSQTYAATLDSANHGCYHSIRHRKTLQYGSVNGPTVTDTYIGCPGGIQMYCSSLPTSTNFLNVAITGTYQFASRS